MVMKHFLGSHKSGLRKNAYVEKILKKKKNQSYYCNTKYFQKRLKRPCGIIFQ